MLEPTGEPGKNVLMKKVVEKSVELDSLKELRRKYGALLGHKRQELYQEKKKLGKLHFELWGQNDEFCEMVWSFFREQGCPDYIKQRKKQENDPEITDNLRKEIEMLKQDIRGLQDDLLTISKPSHPEASTFVYKTPRIKPKNRFSCFTLKKKSKHCERFEKHFDKEKN